MNNMITIMATHNGSLYIKEAIASITDDCDLFISDDSSIDNTLCILNTFKDENRLITIANCSAGSASRNFSHAINAVSDKYEYYFLSDQDDVWSNNKSKLLHEEISDLQLLNGNNTPILIFGDSIVVDQDLNEIAKSFFKYDGISPVILNNPLNIFFQNIGQGATFVFNRAFLNLIRPMPVDVYMHDWWLILYACHFGVLHLSKHKTLYYRQHGNNQIGAKKRKLLSQIIDNTRGDGKVEQHMTLIKKQISTFIKHTSRFNSSKSAILINFESEYENIKNMSWLKRKVFILKHKIFLSNIKRTLALYFYF
ncbi:MAG: glycosyltransferase [Plesiomonas sp.]|uniref:glycosyltransferase n=1 Tax=Plesiomonas sp. TaxID=2486279 RepID=UPI003F339519